MGMISSMKKIPLYMTWYDFRRELGKRLGCVPLNRQWLQIKPRVALPWDESHMQASLSRSIEQSQRKESIKHKADETTDTMRD